MLRRFIWLLLAIPAAIFLVTLAVANRHAVRLVLDPFRPEAPVISMELPFFVYLFATLMLGVILGGIATWKNKPRVCTYAIASARTTRITGKKCQLTRCRGCGGRPAKR